MSDLAEPRRQLDLVVRSMSTRSKLYAAIVDLGRSPLDVDATHRVRSLQHTALVADAALRHELDYDELGRLINAEPSTTHRDAHPDETDGDPS